MKFHVKRSAFVQTFTRIARFVPKRGARPIFQRALLIADEYGVALETVVSEGVFDDGAGSRIDSSYAVDAERERPARRRATVKTRFPRTAGSTRE